MQTAIALLALSLGFANFNYVDRLKKSAPKNQEAPFAYPADFVRKHKSSRIFSTTEYAHEPRCRSPPLLKFRVMVYQISEESEGPLLYTRYFRKKNPTSGTADVEWVEMSGEEFYSFVTAPENRNRYFIDMGDVVLECSKAEYKKFKAEDDHSSYILEQEEGWITQSLEDVAREKNICGDELIADLTQNVEATALKRIETDILGAALAQLDEKSYWLIYALYFAEERKTERELAKMTSVSQNAVHKQKKKILKTLKFLVVKISKSSQ